MAICTKRRSTYKKKMLCPDEPDVLIGHAIAELSHIK
jgi:hypothetical protein